MVTVTIPTAAPDWRERMAGLLRRSSAMMSAVAVLAVMFAVCFALASYHPGDPSLNTAAGGPARNLLGTPGAWSADLLLVLFGPAIALALASPLLIALRLWRGVPLGRWKRDLGLMILAAMFLGVALALARDGAVVGLP